MTTALVHEAPDRPNADLAPGLAEHALDAVVRAAMDMHSRGVDALDLDARAMMALERAILGEPVARGNLVDVLAVRMTKELYRRPGSA